MQLSSKQLIGLSVQTKSGNDLGSVSELIVDVDSHEIEQYSVQPDLIHGLFGKKLLVHRSQVLAITDERMVVEDLVVQQRNLQPATDS